MSKPTINKMKRKFTSLYLFPHIEINPKKLLLENIAIIKNPKPIPEISNLSTWELKNKQKTISITFIPENSTLLKRLQKKYDEIEITKIPLNQATIITNYAPIVEKILFPS